jgi:hypothetical protein
VIGQEQRYLDFENRLMIKPDIVVRRGSSTAFVLDSKYILAGDGTTHVDHHAQLLSYAIRHDIKDVALVYVLEPLLTPPATDVVTTIRHAEVRIHSWTLDLTQGPAQIEAGMSDLAKRVLDMLSARAVTRTARHRLGDDTDSGKAGTQDDAPRQTAGIGQTRGGHS